MSLAALFLVVATACRAAMLTRDSYWTDELWSLDASGMDFKSMFGARLRGEQNPPLYYLTLWFWTRLTQSVGEIPVRGLSLVFATITLVTLWRLGSVLGDRSVGIISALLMAVSGVATHYALEARGYGMATMFVALSLRPWLLLMTSRERVPRNAFLFALFGSLAGFTHYYGNLAYALMGIILLSVLLGTRGSSQSRV